MLVGTKETINLKGPLLFYKLRECGVNMKSLGDSRK